MRQDDSSLRRYRVAGDRGRGVRVTSALFRAGRIADGSGTFDRRSHWCRNRLRDRVHIGRHHAGCRCHHVGKQRGTRSATAGYNRDAQPSSHSEGPLRQLRATDHTGHSAVRRSGGGGRDNQSLSTGGTSSATGTWTGHRRRARGISSHSTFWLGPIASGCSAGS